MARVRPGGAGFYGSDVCPNAELGECVTGYFQPIPWKYLVTLFSETHGSGSEHVRGWKSQSPLVVASAV